MPSLDFTGILALLLSGLVGFLATLAFAMRGGRNYARLFATILSVSVLVDFALLVDWGRSDEITARFLLGDAILFAVVALIGGAATAAPVLFCYWIYKVAKRRELL